MKIILEVNMSSTKPTTREKVLKFRPDVNSSVFMNYKSHRLSLRRGNVYLKRFMPSC